MRRSSSLALASIFLMLVFVFAYANDNPQLYVSPNPITLGQPFQIWVVPPSAARPIKNCSFAFTPESVPETAAFFTLSPSLDDLTTSTIAQAVIYGCPSESSVKISMNCTDPVEFKLFNSTIHIRSTGMAADLKTTRANEELVTASLNLTTPFPITGVTCNVTIDDEQNPKTIELCTGTGEKKICHFDLIGDSSLLLQVNLTTLQTKSGFTVKCTGGFGTVSNCPYVNMPVKPPPPGMELKSVTSVQAGNNFDVTATIPTGSITNSSCVLHLPNAKYHLNTTDTNCTAGSGTTDYKCDTSAWASPKTLQVHVDSSANSTHTGNLSLTCGASVASTENVTVETKAGLDEVKMRVFRFGTLGLNVSLTFNNSGPSDLGLKCHLTYPLTLDKIAADCRSPGPNFKCPIFLTLPGRDMNEQITAYVHVIPFFLPKDGDFFAQTTRQFILDDCTSSSDETKKYQVFLNKTISPGDDLEWVDKDEVITRPTGDSYFWTYTIVIINLFAIALVVFVGMWWRNRNMNRTLNGDGRAGGDRFTELELFSAPSTDGRLPLSKKD